MPACSPLKLSLGLSAMHSSTLYSQIPSHQSFSRLRVTPAFSASAASWRTRRPGHLCNDLGGVIARQPDTIRFAHACPLTRRYNATHRTAILATATTRATPALLRARQVSDHRCHPQQLLERRGRLLILYRVRCVALVSSSEGASMSETNGVGLAGYHPPRSVGTDDRSTCAPAGSARREGQRHAETRER